MLERLFADIDRVRAEAAEQYAAGLTDTPAFRANPGPSPHRGVAILSRIMLLTIAGSIIIGIMAPGTDLAFGARLALIAVLATSLLVRAGSLAGILPREMYPENSWLAIVRRTLIFTWFLALTIWPVLIAVTIPVVIVLRWNTIHRISLWAMKRQELRRLAAGKPPTPPILGRSD